MHTHTHTFLFDRSIRTKAFTHNGGQDTQWAPSLSSTCLFLSFLFLSLFLSFLFLSLFLSFFLYTILSRWLCVFLRYCTCVCSSCSRHWYLSLSWLSMLFVVVVQFSFSVLFSFFFALPLWFSCLLFSMYVCVSCFCISLLTYTRVFVRCKVKAWNRLIQLRCWTRDWSVSWSNINHWEVCHRGGMNRSLASNPSMDGK